jgi:hypothetical protein
MLQLLLRRHELFQEFEQFPNLLLGKVSVVAGILDFNGVDMLVAPCDDVRKGIETRIADRNSYSKEMVLPQELN